MAAAGPQIQFAQEARAYSLLLLEALLAGGAIVRIERRGTSLAMESLLVASLLAMTLTHYFAVGTIIALAIYAAVRLTGRTRTRVGSCFLVAAIGWGILGAPLALRQSKTLDDSPAAFPADHAPGHASRTLTRVAMLPIRYFTEPMTHSRPAGAVGAVAFVLAMLLPLRRREMLLWGLWLLLTILPIVVLDCVRRTAHLDFLRYTLLASPALYAMVACATATSKTRWMRHVPPLLVALSCIMALEAAYRTWWKANWRELAYAIDKHARVGDVIVFCREPTRETYPNSAYVHTSYYRRTPQGPIVLLGIPPDENLLSQLRHAGGVLGVNLNNGFSPDALPGARLQWLAFEPGAGSLWRATWPTSR
jgi:hypothetical protein